MSRKCYLYGEQDVVDWILEPLSATDLTLFTKVRDQPGKHARALHRSLDCNVTHLADNIAFGVHDLEDALTLSQMTAEEFRRLVLEEDCSSFLTILKEKNRSEFGNDLYQRLVAKLFGDASARKRMIGRARCRCSFRTKSSLV